MENIHFEEKYKNIVDRSMGKYIESSIVEYFHESVIRELSIPPVFLNFTSKLYQTQCVRVLSKKNT